MRPGRAAKAVADVAVEALSAPPGSEVVLLVADELARVLDVDAVALTEHQWRGWSDLRIVRPSAAWSRLQWRRLPTQELAEIHPAVAYLAAHPVMEPFALTDVVTMSEWLSSPFMAANRSAWGRHLQLAIPTSRSDSGTWHWSSSRDRDYSPGDLEVAVAVQPVLQVVTNHILSSQSCRTADGGVTIGLTERELLVLRLLADGMTAAALARRLGISRRTVEKHVERIYRKMGVRDRLVAVRTAQELNIIAPGPLRAESHCP
jgi:DNA-binding CsgD family transcriptional regulator